jgi:hypothetical protein
MKGLSSYMPYKDDPDALERGPDDGEAFQMNEQIMMGMFNLPLPFEAQPSYDCTRTPFLHRPRSSIRPSLGINQPTT